MANSPSNLERVDAFSDEMAEQLGPGGLLLVRRVPDTRSAGYVVPPGSTGGICELLERTLRRSLMPEPTAKQSSRLRRDSLLEVHDHT
jgi:hypothetical protein